VDREHGKLESYPARKGGAIEDNAPAGVIAMGGTDQTTTIPATNVFRATGSVLLNLPQINGGVPADIRLNPNIILGFTNGFPGLYASNPFQGGSSVSHRDTTLTPNQLMEPFINPGLSQSLRPPGTSACCCWIRE
jgi:hypothetical protein